MVWLPQSWGTRLQPVEWWKTVIFSPQSYRRRTLCPVVTFNKPYSNSRFESHVKMAIFNTYTAEHVGLECGFLIAHMHCMKSHAL